MAYCLKTFGQLKLVNSAEEEVAFPEKGLLLLAYLITTGKQSESRGHLAEFLWGPDEDGAALANLRKMISRVKKRQIDIGATFLMFDEKRGTIDLSHLASDASMFLRPQTADQMLSLRFLVERMQRDFLGGIHCNTNEFLAWRNDQRRRQLGVLKASLEQLNASKLDPRETELVKAAAMLLFRAEPDDSQTRTLLIRLFKAEDEIEHLRQHLVTRASAAERGIRLVSASTPNAGVYSGSNDNERPPRDDPGQHSTRSIPSLLLLPPGQQPSTTAPNILATLLIEDLTIGFCTFNSVRAIAPHSALQIGNNLDEQLNFFDRYRIHYSLDTRVTEIGDEMSLFAQLSFVPDSHVIWAERFSLQRKSLLQGRRLIARQIAMRVAGEVERHEEGRAYRELDADAYHQYLQGRRYMAQLSLPNLRRARREMKQALHISGQFAPALSTIARTYSKEWVLTARGDRELLETSEAFAARAIQTRADLPDGYREFGVAKLLQGAFDESAEALDVAETLGPHYADVIADYADTLVHGSQPKAAIEKIEKAIGLNPLSPDYYFWTAAGASYALEDYDSTLSYIGQMHDPSLADRLSAASYAMLGERDSARQMVLRVRRANPNFDVDRWLSAIPVKEQWHKDLYREGLKRAGF